MFWEMEINSTKTFHEFMTEHPAFYDSAIGFSFNNASNQWEQGSVDSVLKDLLFGHFYDRYICDDDKFERLFRNRLNNTALRWAQMRRLELTAFDPLVANYVEREIRGEDNAVNSGNRVVNSSEIGSIDRNSNGTKNETMNGSGSNNTGETFTPRVHERTIDKFTPRAKVIEDSTFTPMGKEIVTDTRTPRNWKEITQSTADGVETVEQLTDGVNETFSKDETIAKQGQKNSPQSIEYQSGSGGVGPNVGNTEYNGDESKLPDFDWRYLTGQAQSDTTNGRHEKATTNQGTIKTTRSDPRVQKSFEGQDENKREKTWANGYNEKTKKETTNVGYDEHQIDRYSGIEGVDTRNTTTQSSNSNQKDVVDANVEHESNNLTGNENEITNDSSSKFNQSREIMTGRSGLTPQDALAKAASWIKASDAWSWIEREFEPLFMNPSYNPND